MRNKLKAYQLTGKTLIAALSFLLIGTVCLFIENTFYQYLDENGVLHESLCLPIGAFSLMLGVLLLFYWLVKQTIILIKNNGQL